MRQQSRDYLLLALIAAAILFVVVLALQLPDLP